MIALTRLGLGHPAGEIPVITDCEQLWEQARKQELQAVVLDGMEELRRREPSRKDIPSQEIVLPWISEIIRNFEKRYEAYEHVLANLAGFYARSGIRMMTFKGYVCSLDWPVPNHRPCGDIDIWLFGMQKEADSLLEQKGVSIDNSHHHHTIFSTGGFMVENHYDFIDVDHHHSGQKMEVLLKELAADDSHFIMVRGQKVYIPSPHLNALFLVYHTMLHFVSTEMTLRQLLDWGFYAKKHGKELDWNWLLGVLEEYHLTQFFHCINAILVEDLGFEAGIFPALAFEPALKARIREAILSQSVVKTEPARFLPRVLFRYRRWKGNNWKRRLCFPDSVWSIFWLGVKAHIKKPGTI